MKYAQLLFAQFETDWPEHRRCMALKDNDTRWLHVCLWTQAMKYRSPIVKPENTDFAWFKAHAKATPEQVQERLKDMREQELVGITPDGDLFVVGLVEKHKRVIEWEDAEPTESIDPWAVDPGWNYGTRLGSAPPKERTAKAKGPLAKHPVLAAFYPRLNEMLKKAHDKVTIPGANTADERKAMEALASLVEKHGFAEQTVVDVLTWVLTKEKPRGSDDFSWRKEFWAIIRLPVIKNGATKFARMAEDYDRLVKGKAEPEPEDDKEPAKSKFQQTDKLWIRYGLKDGKVIYGEGGAWDRTSVEKKWTKPVTPETAEKALWALAKTCLPKEEEGD